MPAPKLITREMIESMKLGSVVVDLAAETGGNIETTRPGELYVYKNVIFIGYTDFPSRLPTQSSTLYANNISKFLLSMGQKDHFNIDLNDEVVRGSIILNKGELMWPPPVVSNPSLVAAKTVQKSAKIKMGDIMAPTNADQWLATIAAFISSINITSGFIITHKMLDMFKRTTDPPEFNVS